MPSVLIPLAPGFEEIEAVTLTDVLRRGSAGVVLASTTASTSVEGSHAIRVEADVLLSRVLERDFDLILLPGGEPGTTHLAEDVALCSKLEAQAAAGRPLGAICAAPRVLAALGLLRGRHATSHPSVAAALRQAGALYSEDRVVRHGNLLTSRGPGTALEFALAALEMLGETAHAVDLGRAMLVRR